MSEPVFVKVRNDQGKIYDSYTDYYQLVKLENFPTCELDEVDPKSNNTYIFPVNNGNVKACCERPHKARYILHQLERPGKVDNSVPDYVDTMWVSDRYFHSLVKDPRCQYVTIGGHKDLGGVPKTPKKWDIVHISYLYGKRAEDMDNLRQMGYMIAEPGWGEYRDETLAYSRWGVCLHQDDMPVIEPLRYVLFACWQLPILAEPSVDFHPYEVHVWSGGFIWDKEIAYQNNYRRMTEELTFRKCIEGAL